MSRTNPLILQTEQIDPNASPLFFDLPEGQRVFIGKHNLDFFQKLQKFPPSTRIEMMELSEEDMLNYINNTKREKAKMVINILTNTWYFRETGEIATLLPEFISEVNLHAPVIIRKLRRNPLSLSIHQLDAIIEFYTGDRSEVYSSDPSICVAVLDHDLPEEKQTFALQASPTSFEEEFILYKTLTKTNP